MTARSALPLLTILEDTRQQVRLVWPDGVTIESATLKEGDFTTPALRGIAAIELKRGDYCASVGRDRPRVDREIERLQPYRWKCLIVADDITAVYRKSLVHPNSILGTIASLYARHDVPTLFVGNDAGAARLISGLLRRWQERVAEEGGAAA
jgi:ERCC4-type nuclease